MSDVGSTFELYGYFTPTGHFPARLIVVFKISGDNSIQPMVFYPELGEDGYIKEFVAIENNRAHDVIIPASVRKFSGVGHSMVHAVAFDPEDIIVALGIESFKELLRDRLSNDTGELGIENPFFTLELSRFVGAADLEARYAATAVVKIANTSTEVASTWLNNAPLSAEARQSALKAFSEFTMQNSGDAELLEAFATIMFSHSTYFQGELVHEFSSDRVIIRLDGKYYIGQRPSRNLPRNYSHVDDDLSVGLDLLRDSRVDNIREFLNREDDIVVSADNVKIIHVPYSEIQT